MVAIGIVIFCPIYIYKREKGKTIKILFTVILVTAIPITWYMTHCYRLKYDEDTVAHGWPVPRAIFQRDEPGEP